jgi:hypothetical protein
MQMQIYQTEFCGDHYWIRADWSHPHCQVAMTSCDGKLAFEEIEPDWVYCGFEVEEATAPSVAMEMVLREIVRDSGDDPDDEENKALIARAIDRLHEVES